VGKNDENLPGPLPHPPERERRVDVSERPRRGTVSACLPCGEAEAVEGGRSAVVIWVALDGPLRDTGPTAHGDRGPVGERVRADGFTADRDW